MLTLLKSRILPYALLTAAVVAVYYYGSYQIAKHELRAEQVAADVARQTAEHNAGQAARLAQELKRQQAAEQRRQQRLAAVARETTALKAALQEARQHASVEYQNCARVAAPDYVVRLQPPADHPD